MKNPQVKTKIVLITFQEVKMSDVISIIFCLVLTSLPISIDAIYTGKKKLNIFISKLYHVDICKLHLIFDIN